MNRITALVVAVAIGSVSGVAFAGTGLAGDITIETEPFVLTKSRGDVRAEFDSFRKAGVNPWDDDYNQLAGFMSSRTRAEITAEYVANRDAVAALHGEDSGSRYLAEGRAGRRDVLIARRAASR